MDALAQWTQLALAIVVPFCVFLVIRSFDQDKRIAVLESRTASTDEGQSEIKKELKELKNHMDNRLDKVIEIITK